MEDTELVLVAKQSNLNAFNELVLKYQNQVFDHAYHLLGNYDIAEDVSQDAFILAFRRIHQHRGGSFRAWLFKIVTNLCYTEMRTWRRNTFQMLEPIDYEGEVNESPRWMKDPRPVPEEEVEANDLRELLENSLKKLPYDYQMALSLIDIQELDYMEAASVMGVPIGTVKSRVARGRMQFRRILEAEDTLGNSKHRVVTRPAPTTLPG